MSRSTTERRIEDTNVAGVLRVSVCGDFMRRDSEFTVSFTDTKGEMGLRIWQSTSQNLCPPSDAAAVLCEIANWRQTAFSLFYLDGGLDCEETKNVFALSFV